MDINELLGNPAVQGALVPFVVALIAAGLLRSTRLTGLAVALGVCCTVYLTIGWSFESMSATRKLSILVLVTALLVLLIEWFQPPRRLLLQAVLALLAGLGGLWMTFGVVRQMESGALLAGVAVVVFVAGLVFSSAAASRDNVRASAGMLMLGLGAGGFGLLGASAVLALFGIAAGASAGALLLTQMVRGQASPSGWTLVLPASVVAALVPVMASLTGGVRWFLLLPLLAVPWCARLVPTDKFPVWLEALLASALALIPVALALGLGWMMQAPQSY
jgi:hypothetical protein